MCFSLPFSDKVLQKLDQTPNGRWCVAAVFFATLAWILSLSAPVPCSFVIRNVALKQEIPNISSQMKNVLFQSHGVGFWGWSAQGQCLSFEISGKKPSYGGIYNAASAFSTLTVLFGGIGMVCLWLGVCFPFQPQRFKQFGGVLLAAVLFSGLTDLIFVSSVCQADFFQYVTSTVKLVDAIQASCSVGTGSLLNISATIFLFLAAIICEVSPLAKGGATAGAATARRTTAPALLPPSGDSDRLGDRFDDEEFDDEGSSLHLDRKAETERRYREMFGDEDPDADDSVLMADDEKNPFASAHAHSMGGLDPVMEDSEHLSSDRGKAFDKFGSAGVGGVIDDDEDDMDGDGEVASKGSMSRGTRSRGSRSRGSRSRNSRHSHYSDEDESRGSRGSHSRDSRSYYSGDDEDRSRDSRSRDGGGGGGGDRSRDSRSRGSRSHYSDEDRSYSGDDRSADRGSQYSRSAGSRSGYDNHLHDDRSQASRSYYSNSYHDDDRSKGERSELV